VTQEQYLAAEIERWKTTFKDHVATLGGDAIFNPSSSQAITIIDWKKPGTGNYSLQFLLRGPYLCCIGDLGDSVLQWSEVITPQFLAGCDFHYWFGKKRAWPGGKADWKQWDDAVAKAWATDEGNAFEEGSPDSVLHDVRQVLIDANGDSHEFEEAANDYNDQTGDFETAAAIHDAGMVPDCLAVAQYVGLQMALVKLGYRKEAP